MVETPRKSLPAAGAHASSLARTPDELPKATSSVAAMHAEGRVHHPARDGSEAGPQASFAPGAFVVLRSPRSLRGATAIVRRPVPEGWEVEVRSPAGTPMHLVVSERAMLPE